MITEQNRLKVLLACTAAFFALYGIPNRFSLGVPRQLGFTWLDAQTPFWVESVWVYFSAYGMIYATFFAVRDLWVLHRLLYTFLTLMVVSSAIFVLYPTVYPRGDFPLPADDSWTTFAFHYLRVADLPTNCAPSLHVGISVLSALPFFSERRWKHAGVFTLWTLAIWVSTATTKQHYWVDGAYGALLTSAIYSFYGSRWVRPAPDRLQSSRG